jgi:hypothetical protein
LDLPGRVEPALAHQDTPTRLDRLTDGLSGGLLRDWFEPSAPLASAQIRDGGIPLTRSGSLVLYRLGSADLIIDNLRWQSPDLAQPWRVKRWLCGLLTQVGLRLG